jgi:hypothetical protein
MQIPLRNLVVGQILVKESEILDVGGSRGDGRNGVELDLHKELDVRCIWWLTKGLCLRT